ncbi:MAG: DUF4382 domain-containing protein, partial [Deltaproteobacteria bacterium]|nr:DUF4382 domain-containing protein [Deltaproteobacteria bacterium]
MKVLKRNVCIMVFLFLIILNGCSGISSSGDTGALSLSLTDASSDQYRAVYVTIDEIKVHSKEEDKWITVASPKTTYNLLNLVNGRMETLGEAELKPGVYTQMRLYLGDAPYEKNKTLLGNLHPYANYVIEADDGDIHELKGDVHELKVPSGYQTGVKLVHQFEIVAGLTVDLVLDFDACASVVKAGKSGTYLLKPAIKITDAVNNAIVNGIVLGAQQMGVEDNAVGLEGATVSAQTHNETSNAKDQVLVYTATITT